MAKFTGDELETSEPALEAATDAERDEGYSCFGTEDFRIGYRAFLAKTKPQFKGR